MQRPRSFRLALVVSLAATVTGCNADGDAVLAPTDAGASTLTRVVPEPAGARCPLGGQAIEAGADANGDGQLDAAERTSITYVCAVVAPTEAPTGDAGSDMSDAGDVGDAGTDAGPPPPPGQFALSQPVLGLTLTCLQASLTAGGAACIGMKVSGLDVRATHPEADAICDAITRKGVGGFSSGDSTSAFVKLESTGWVVAQSGTAIAMTNLTCFR